MIQSEIFWPGRQKLTSCLEFLEHWNGFCPVLKTRREDMAHGPNFLVARRDSLFLVLLSCVVLSWCLFLSKNSTYFMSWAIEHCLRVLYILYNSKSTSYRYYLELFDFGLSSKWVSAPWRVACVASCVSSVDWRAIFAISVAASSARCATSCAV